MTTAEKLALEVLDALNAGEIDRVGALVHEDFVDHGAPPWAPQGRAGLPGDPAGSCTTR